MLRDFSRTPPRPLFRAVHAVLAGALALGLLGCGGGAARDPGSVLRQYARAVENGRADEAYALLSNEAKKGVSKQDFTKLLRDNPTEAKELGRALARPSMPAVVHARVVTDSGQEVELVLENGRWVLDGAAIDLYAQDTPRHTVAGFLRAVERKRYDVLLRFVPAGHREGLDAKKLQEAWEGPERDELLATLLSIKQALGTASIEQQGDHAVLPHSTGSMELLRENGVWKVENFD